MVEEEHQLILCRPVMFMTKLHMILNYLQVRVLLIPY